MPRTLHHFARSRGLQLAALLAWLLLAIAPAFGLPTVMLGGMPHHGDAAAPMQMTSLGDRATSVGGDQPCCESDDGSCSGHACGCVAASGTVALLSIASRLAPARFTNVSWAQFSSRVPGARSKPPLRPPTA